MLRTRNTEGFKPHTQYETATGFLGSQITTGYHTIKLGTQTLDLLVIDRNASATLVVFHSALPESIKSVPVLQGRSLSRDSGMNLIAIADPSLELGDVDLCWYLGNRGTGKLRPIMSPLIRHALEALETKRTVLFGASGGGYAAVNFGQDFPGSLVLAVNPRLDLTARPPAKVPEYLRVCHNAVSATPQQRIRKEFVVERLTESFSNGLPFDLLLFQNTGDVVYTSHQARPFLEEHSEDPRLFSRMEHTSSGHTPIPGQTLRAILSALSNAEQPRAEAIAQAGFKSHTKEAHQLRYPAA